MLGQGALGQFALGQGVNFTGTEAVAESKWHQPWSDPVRTKSRLIDANQQAFCVDVNPRVSFSWFENFSDPVRTKSRLIDANQQAFFVDVKPRVSFSWFENLSDPVRIISRLGTGSQQYQEFTETIFKESTTVDRWLLQWECPVRFKPALRKELQSSFTTSALSIGNPYARGYIIC